MKKLLAMFTVFALVFSLASTALASHVNLYVLDEEDNIIEVMEQTHTIEVGEALTLLATAPKKRSNATVEWEITIHTENGTVEYSPLDGEFENPNTSAQAVKVFSDSIGEEIEEWHAHASFIPQISGTYTIKVTITNLAGNGAEHESGSDSLNVAVTEPVEEEETEVTYYNKGMEQRAKVVSEKAPVTPKGIADKSK